MELNIKKFFYLLVIGCGYVGVSYSSTPQHSINNYSVGLGAPIVTATADTMDKGGWSINQRTEYYRMNPLSDATLLEFSTSESEKALLINYFMMSYGLLDNLTVGANLPIQHTYNLRAATDAEDNLFPSVNNLGDISGAADSSLFGLWRIGDESEGKLPMAMALLFGMNLPTGKTTARSRQGELFSASDQPGTGAWVPLGGLIFSKKWGDLSISSNFIYTQTTKGSQDTILGSYFDYNFAADYPLLEHKGKLNYNLEGMLELTGEYAAKDKVDGIKDPNSGGNSIYLNPGVRMNIEEKISCYLGIGIPVSEKFNGTQVTSRYAIYTGIDINF